MYSFLFPPHWKTCSFWPCTSPKRVLPQGPLPKGGAGLPGGHPGRGSRRPFPADRAQSASGGPHCQKILRRRRRAGRPHLHRHHRAHQGGIHLRQRKGQPFFTYASRCIENEILMYFRSRKKAAQDISLFDPIDTDKDGNALTLGDLMADEGNILDEIDLSIRSEQLHRFIKNGWSPGSRRSCTGATALAGGCPTPSGKPPPGWAFPQLCLRIEKKPSKNCGRLPGNGHHRLTDARFRRTIKPQSRGFPPQGSLQLQRTERQCSISMRKQRSTKTM